MMEEDMNKGHEHYLRHILLLGQAAPLPLRAIVRRAISNCGNSLEDILSKAKYTFKLLFPSEFRKLFADDEINTDLNSWDTRLLCVVLCDLFISELSPFERNIIKIIVDQRNDLENYTVVASLDHLTFKSKWKTIHEALLKLLKNVDAKTKFACIRLIDSFALEPINVNETLIEKMKEESDVSKHVLMAIQYKVISKVHGKSEGVLNEGTEFTDGGKQSKLKDDTRSADDKKKAENHDMPVRFVRNLRDLSMKESETITLECELTERGVPVKWLMNDLKILPDNRTKISMHGFIHQMVIENISCSDSAKYSCVLDSVRSECYVRVEESPTLFSEKLKDLQVYENEDVTFTCELNKGNGNFRWFKRSSQLELSENVSIETKSHRSCLKITKANKDDTGIYSCHSRNDVTSAYLTVKELKTTFSKHLKDVTGKEFGELTLQCELTTAVSVKWLKDSTEIIADERTKIYSSGIVHQLVVENLMVNDSGKYACVMDTIRTECYVKVEESPTIFSTILQDTSVYEDENVTLTCEINKENENSKWFKSSTKIEESDTISIGMKSGRQFLNIKEATPKHSGIYSCHSRDSVTSAYLTVKEKPLEFTEHLAETQITENDDVTLACKVNVLNKNPVWYYEDTQITSSVRRQIISHRYDHKLTILNVKLFDDGKYSIKFGDVKSEAFLTVKGVTNISHKQQLTDELYKNWVRSALGLKYLKQGIEEFSNACVKKHHAILTNNLPTQGLPCMYCNIDNLLPFQNHLNNKKCPNRKCLCYKRSKQPPKRILCPNGSFCSNLYDNILADHRFAAPLLENANITSWSTNPWSVGTCYINTTGYINKKSAVEIDCSGLLSLVINNTFFNSELGDVGIDGTTDLFKKARDARNDILHSPNYELSESELNHYIDLFKKVLEIRNAANIKPLEKEIGVAEAIRKLQDLQKGGILIFEKIEPYLNGLRQHSMNEEADKLEEAKTERDKKIKLLESRLKEQEDELKLMRCLRAAPKKKQTVKLKVVFDMQINVVSASERITNEANRDVLEVMTNYTSTDGRIQAIKKPTSGLVVNLNAILEAVIHLPDTEVQLVKDSRVLRIKCSSKKGVDKLIAYTNGNQLQDNLFQLRKFFEKSARKSFGIYANVTSDSSSRKSLREQGVVKDIDCAYKCHCDSSMEMVCYCPAHDVFCCKKCALTDHKLCNNLNHFTSCKKEEASVEVKCKTEYNIKSAGNDLKNICTFGICMLPNGFILLADNYNKNLKKLDPSYTLVSCQRVLDYPYAVCYIHKLRAVVSFMNKCIQFVDILGDIKLKKVVNLDHVCLGMACHGNTLYITDKNNVYTYNTDGENKQCLYIHQEVMVAGSVFEQIAISEDGMKIYIAYGSGGLITIDSDGSHPFTLKQQTKVAVRDVCIGVDGTVFEYDEYTDSVLQVDSSGKRILGTIVRKPCMSSKVAAFHYDQKRSKLILGCRGRDRITVIELERRNSNDN